MSAYQVALHEAATPWPAWCWASRCSRCGHAPLARSLAATQHCPPGDAAIVFASGYLMEDVASWSESSCRGDDLAELSRLSAVVLLADAYRSARDRLTDHASALYDLAGWLAEVGGGRCRHPPVGRPDC